MTSKLAIVASDGGMTYVYSVGALMALVDKYKLTQPDIVTGCSGSPGTMAYFTAGQYASIKTFGLTYCAMKSF